MIASSTSMPTARISENRTTMLMVNPQSDRASIPIRNDAGIARPIRIEARVDGVGEFLRQAADDLRRAPIRSDPERVRVLDREQVADRIERSRNVLVVHRHRVHSATLQDGRQGCVSAPSAQRRDRLQPFRSQARPWRLATSSPAASPS